MQRLIIHFIFILPICLNAQVGSFLNWKKQQNKAYIQWEQAQKWEHNYIRWQEHTDDEYEQWKKEAGWVDEESTTTFDNQFLYEGFESNLSILKDSIAALLENINTSNETNDLLQEEINASQSQIDGMLDLIERMDAENNRLSNLNQLNEQNGTVNAERIHNLQNQVQRLEKENAQLLQGDTTGQEQIDAYQAQLLEMQALITELEKENQNLNQLQNAPPVKKMKIWAVIVGVANYEEEEAKLNYCDDDAYKMYAFFKSPAGGAIPDERIKLLIDEDATGQNISKALRYVSENALSEDVIIFYFSGHGSSNALLARDFTRNYTGVINHSDINNYINNTKAKFAYCIVDACHSAGIINIPNSKGMGQQKKSIRELEKSE